MKTACLHEIPTSAIGSLMGSSVCMSSSIKEVFRRHNFNSFAIFSAIQLKVAEAQKCSFWILDLAPCVKFMPEV